MKTYQDTFIEKYLKILHERSLHVILSAFYYYCNDSYDAADTIMLKEDNLPLPSEKDIREAVFEFDGLVEKTLLRWPIPINAPKNIAFYEGIKWYDQWIKYHKLNG